MIRTEISRILGEVQQLDAMADHARGLGNEGLVNNLLDQIERKLDVVQPFIEASAGGKLVQRGEDFEFVKQRHAEYQTRLGAMRNGVW